MAKEKRLIDAHQFRGKHEVAEVNGKLCSVICYADIVNAPTVDAVEVVRCKDCHWRNRNYCMHPTDGMNVTQDDDFCSYGERREGE